MLTFTGIVIGSLFAGGAFNFFIKLGNDEKKKSFLSLPLGLAAGTVKGFLLGYCVFFVIETYLPDFGDSMETSLLYPFFPPVHEIVSNFANGLGRLIA